MVRRTTLGIVVLFMGAWPAAATPPGANGKLVFGCPATPDPSGGATSAICVMNPDGTGRTRILDGNGEQPVWSPDGSKIAFVSSRTSTPPSVGAASSDIWVMNADGSNPTQLTFTSSDARPAWSPDGRIAFTSYRDHVADGSFRSSIYVMDADGSNQHAVTTVDTDTYDDQPAWSPDGQRLAFVRFGYAGGGIDGGYQEIYTVNADGSNFRQLTMVADFTPSYGISKNKPSWSPDGARVAFTETPWLDPSLAFSVVGLVNADGTNEHFLTTNSDTLPDGPNVDILDAVWAPDGTKLIGTCSFAAPTTTPGDHLCIIDAATGAVSGPIETIRPEFDPDWGRASAPTNLTITDCNDPRLAQTSVVGSIVIVNQPGCAAFNLGATTVVGNVVITDDESVTTVNAGALTQVTGNLTLSDNSGVTTIDVSSLVGTGGNLTLSGNAGVTAINLGSLQQAGNVTITDNSGTQTISVGDGTLGTGNLTITDNDGVQTINLGVANAAGNVIITGNTSSTTVNASLGAVVGNVTITDNGAATVVNLGNGASIGGNLTLESAGSVNAGGTQTGGTVTIIANNGDSVSANTGGGGTDVSILGGVASMRVVIPAGAFTQPVAFTIARLDPAPAQPGTAPDGTTALVQPIAPYRFSFALPTLNLDAQLAFRVDLSQLDAATLAAVLAGLADGSTTMATQGDAPGATYQAFPVCLAGQTPVIDHCVTTTLLAADGVTVVADPSVAVFLNVAGLAGHFSRWSVVHVTPLDLTPPSVTISVTAPNAGVPDGQNGWFVSGPVTGTVQASKTSGPSAVTSLTCGTLPLTVAGVGTQRAIGTFVVGSDGVTHLACSAVDGAGNASAPVTLDVKLDRTAPTLAPAVTPATVSLNGTATAAPNASDAVSGLATAGCGPIDTSTAGPHTVTCTATDNAGNVSAATAAYTVIAPATTCLGAPAHQVLAPIAADGSSVFARGLPVPVRFRVCNPAGRSISTRIVSTFRLVGTTTGSVVQHVNLPVRSAVPGLDFFWDPLLREWDFLLATDALKPATTYAYDITLTDASHITFRFTVAADGGRKAIAR